ncbi:sporulation integral membrane protein YtvI [Virgibacillus sp. YIM 98842]|uniref:sporulation integral membrane protein YtvI n=1 Tax=Virgibacillus sp. YIM 98842 TaxID=2663533 RepID=UPI0013DA93BE|nr:sporulation integral membrane protein YtvI [Virgibacillus sp. YIM 98842]
MYKQLFYQSLRFFIIIAVIAGSYLLFKHTWIFLVPIGLAAVFSMCLQPYVSFLENKLKFPRLLATLTVVSVVFMLFAGFLIFIITEIVQGTVFLADQLPAHFQQFIRIMEDMIQTKLLPIYETIISFLHTLEASQQKAINESIEHILGQIAALGSQFLQNLLLLIPDLLTWLPGSATVVMFIIIATVLMTNDWNRLKSGAKSIISPYVHSYLQEIHFHLKKALTGFMKAQFILIFITMLIIFAGLSLLKVDHAVTIALLAALVDLFPYIGTGIIFIPWAVYLFITGNYSLTIGLTLLYMFIIIVRQFLEPKILSSNIGLHPLAVLIALFISMQLWGVAGIIIAPILVVVGIVLFQTGIFHKALMFIKG